MGFKESISWRMNKYGLKLYCDSPVSLKKDTIKDAIIVAANPRGGSTWIGDMLGQTPNSVSYYEPLNVAYIPILRELGFSLRQHLPQGTSNARLKGYFEELLKGKYYNTRMTFHPMTKQQNIVDIIRSKKRVYKFCRINLMLPWLIDTFPDLPKPIVVMRHPCAVIASQLHFGKVHGGDWNGINSHINVVNQANNSIFEPYLDFLNRLKTKEESLAALWCMTNKYLLEHPYNNKKWITISYEQMLIDRQTPLSRIIGGLGLEEYQPLFNNYLDKNKLSKTSLNNTDIVLKEQLSSWKKKLSQIEIDNILNVVDRFNMLKYYNNSLEPNYQSLHNT